MQQTDSIAKEQHNEIPSPEQSAIEQRNFKPRHPYQVLRQLPRDATPAQQDSAIQAAFQPREIHYSEQPDTLHLPGHKAGKSTKEVSLPTYYKETYFANDSLLRNEVNGGRYGVAGDPVPYTMRGDNVITGLLLAFFILAFISITRSSRFITRQAKNFFYTPHSEAVTTFAETYGEINFQVFMVVLNCLLLSILQYFYTQTYIGQTFILSSQYQLIAIYFGCFVGYYLLRAFLYTIVDNIFFGSKKNIQWMKSLLFVTSLTAVLLFPIVLLQVYFNLSMQNVLIYFVVVLILVKILTFYKAYLIFFRQSGGFLQNILYFCALEVIPLATLWLAMVFIGNYLKINY
jgi:hypothetical protein